MRACAFGRSGLAQSNANLVDLAPDLAPDLTLDLALDLASRPSARPN